MATGMCSTEPITSILENMGKAFAKITEQFMKLLNGANGGGKPRDSQSTKECSKQKVARMKMRRQTRSRHIALPRRPVEGSLTADQLEVVRLFEYGWYKHVPRSKGRRAGPRNSWLG